MRPVKEHTLKASNLGEMLVNEEAKRRNIRCAVTYLVIGLTSVISGILSILYDFQELALNERIKVRPGLPAYEMWKNPSVLGVDIGIRLYLFAVENPDEFLSNQTAKLKLKEIGPIIYKKVMRQENIVFHNENSTLSFSTVFDMVFDEERNEPGILNRTITLVNPMLLSIAATASEMFFARMAFNLVAKDDYVFLNRTVYEALWNNSSPIFDFVKQIPFASPTNNAGIMFNAFYPAENRYNVNIGMKHGYKNFFKINTFNGLSRIDVYKENFPKYCPFSLRGASEGTGLPPHIAKDDVIFAYTKNLCRTYPMVYNSTVTVDGIEAYKFVLADEIYTRLDDPDLDCFKQTGGVTLPNGLSDSSKCAWGLPVAVSNPHFWGYYGDWENYLEGLTPSVDKHSSYVTVEPNSGIQLEGIARLQSNLPLPRLDYFSPNIRRFSEMILPQFWMEYFVINKDPIIHVLVNLFLSLPIIQNVFVIVLFALSLFAFYKSFKLTVCLGKIEKTSVEQAVVFEQQLLCPAK